MRHGRGDGRVDRRLLSDVERQAEGVRPQRGGDRLCALFVQIGDDDLRAFLDIALGERPADSAGGAGNDCDLVL